MFPDFKKLYQGILKHKEKQGTELEVKQLKEILR